MEKSKTPKTSRHGRRVLGAYSCNGEDIKLQSNFPSYNALIVLLFPFGINNPERSIPEFYNCSKDNSAYIEKMLICCIFNYLNVLDDVGYFRDRDILTKDYYLLIVSKPICLIDIGTKLDSETNKYKSLTEFYDDLLLMFENCFLYNNNDEPVHKVIIIFKVSKY